MAIKMIRDLTQSAEVGKLYMGTVKKVMEFGAFVEIFPGTDGLVHVSELDTERVRNVTDILKEGDQVLVKCIGVDKQGKIKLSRKEALGSAQPDQG
jgi:polyribonucleotide nucleotidyltransferase